MKYPFFFLSVQSASVLVIALFCSIASTITLMPENRKLSCPINQSILTTVEHGFLEFIGQFFYFGGSCVGTFYFYHSGPGFDVCGSFHEYFEVD